jgi:hypothetical protein
MDCLPTVRATLDALRAACGTDAAAARRIGISRAAFNLARKRARMPEDAIVSAAAVLELPAGFLLAALSADVATTQAVKTAWHEVARTLAPQSSPGTQPLYYVKSQGEEKEQHPENSEKSDNRSKINKTVHEIHPLSEKEKQALLVLQWCLVVARIEPDSPRLAWYCSRWNVPEKIAAAADAGTLADTLAACPQIDRKHLPAGIAAVAAWHEYLQPQIVPAPAKACLHPSKSASAA